MKLPPTWNPLTVHLRKRQHKTNFGAHMTVPDMTLSIKQIQERHTRGLSVQGALEPIYSEIESSLGIDPRTLDLVDIQKWKLENNDLVLRLQQKVTEEMEVAAAKALEAKEKEEQDRIDAVVKKLGQGAKEAH